MRRVTAFAVLSIFAALIAAAVFEHGLPTSSLGSDHTRARRLLADDRPTEAAAIYARLADEGDAVAMNNLAVLKYRGHGVDKDGAAAARLFKRASDAGLTRARLNILLATTLPCPLSGEANEVKRAAALEPFIAAGERLAASYLADCLAVGDGSSAGVGELPDSGARLIAAARIAAETDDVDEQLHMGFKLTALATRTAADERDERPLRPLLPQLTEAAMQHLSAAEDKGEASALLGYSRLAAIPAHLGDSTLALRIKVKTPDQWLDEAADNGHQRSACLRSARITRNWIAQLKRPDLLQPPDRALVQRYKVLNALCRNMPMAPGYAYDPNRSPASTHAAELAYDRRFDRWMHDDAFVIAAPAYPNFEHSYLEAHEAQGLIDLLAHRAIELAKAEGRAAPR